MPEQQRTFGEHVQHQTEKQREYAQREFLRKATDRANRALVLNDYEQLSKMCDRYLLPIMFDTVTMGSLRDREQQLEDKFSYHTGDLYSYAVHGDRDPRTIRRAFESLESIAMDSGIVDDEMRNYVKATGFQSQMGVMYKLYEYDAGDQAQLISYHSGETKTLYHGETGEGKSTALSTDVADRWRINCTGAWEDGKRRREDDIKIIDLIDTDEFENAVYDIPQQQDVLRDIRSRMGLEPDYTTIDGFDRPDIEILVPLTSGLADEELPFEVTDGEVGESPVTGFTVAASDLTKRSLKHFIAGSTPEQRRVIGTCYDRVEESTDDWTLRDLARELHGLDGISDNFKRRAVRNIEDLQATGFIRDKECPHRIDWERIFRETGTITAFSQSFLDEYDSKLMVLSYLFHSIYHKRGEYSNLPPCVGIGRELHEVAPHSQESNGTDREQALQSSIIGELSYILRKNRHQSLEFIFDTQDITDLKRGIRKRFNRAITFQTHEDAMEELFDKVIGNKSLFRSYRDTVSTSVKGRGTVLGKTKPNDEDGTDFLAPVQFAPSAWHVFDDDEYDTGLHERVAYLDEEWRPHDWDTTVPERLQIDSEEIEAEIEAEEKDEREDNGLSPDELKAQHKKEARRRRQMGESINDIRHAIPNNPRTDNAYSTSTIHGWVSDIEPGQPKKART